MECPRCKHDNSPRAKFCEECAAPLARLCAGCGAQLTPTAKFCAECGRSASTDVVAAPQFTSPATYTPKHLADKILTSRAALEGERKHVTVLFADLKGSMEFLAERDPEEARAVLDPVLKRMMEAVHHYEGTVNQVMGDGIMAIFGAPVAHEDHAVRACYAALRMQESVNVLAEEVHRTMGIPLHIRVGMNSGDVVVRSVGSDLHMDYTAVGQTTHLAARMEQMAMPGSILIASSTMYLAEGYVVMKPLGARPVKGMQVPVDVFEVVGATTIRSRLQATAVRGLTKFIGRGTELEMLRRGLERARGGQGQVIALAGEAGVGKSRLFWEFTHSHHVHDWHIIESSSVSYGKATSFLPVIDLLKGYFQLDPTDDVRRIREKVTGRLLALDRALEPFLPGMLSLLDVPHEDPSWDRIDSAQRRQRTLDGIKRLLMTESRIKPLLILFEDLHWIDPETQALLDSLVDSLPAARALLLVNYRPEYVSSWTRKSYFREIRLDPLPPESIEVLLDTLLGGDPVLRPLKRLLVDRTDGNPFFIEESIRTLVETKFLDGSRGAYHLVKAPDSLRIPDSAQAILTARIDRLSADDKRVLQAASVIGKQVPFALLRAVSEESEDALRASLTNLQSAEFLYETNLFPDLEFTFRHALTQEVAYRSMLLERRRAMHAAIVESTEELYPDRLAERFERLAHHAHLGEVWDKSVFYARRGATRLLARSGNHDASLLLEQAVGANGKMPETIETRTLGVDLRFELRGALMPLGEFGRTLDVLREAEQLAAALGDQRRLGWVAGYLTNLYWEMGDQERAVEAGQRAVGIAESLADGSLLDLSHRYLARSYFATGEYRRAAELFTNSIASTGGATAETPAASPSGVLTRAFLSLGLAETGSFTEAMSYGRDCVYIAESLDHPFSVSAAHAAVGRVQLRRGAFEAAAASLTRALAICESADIPLLFPFCASPLGAAYARMGRTSEALELLDQAVKRAMSMHRMVDYSLWMYNLAEALVLAGQLDQGAEVAARAHDVALTYKERGYQAWIARLHGELAARRESFDEARAHYAQSLGAATQLGMRPLEARCHLSLASLEDRCGRPTEADASRARARELCESMDTQFWLATPDARLGAGSHHQPSTESV